jgi:hypothetical protein
MHGDDDDDDDDDLAADNKAEDVGKMLTGSPS